MWVNQGPGLAVLTTLRAPEGWAFRLVTLAFAVAVVCRVVVMLVLLWGWSVSIPEHVMRLWGGAHSPLNVSRWRGSRVV